MTETEIFNLSGLKVGDRKRQIYIGDISPERVIYPAKAIEQSPANHAKMVTAMSIRMWLTDTSVRDVDQVVDQTRLLFH